MDLTKNRFDSGVSPVVGVILMVAVTVILAAVIGTFVLDLGNNVQQNPQAGVTFEQETPGSSTLETSADSDEDYTVNVQIVSITAADKIIVSDGYSGTSDKTMSQVGQSVTLMGPDSNGNGTAEGLNAGDKISVIGSLEGKQTVLQTYTVSDQS